MVTFFLLKVAKKNHESNFMHFQDEMIHLFIFQNDRSEEKMSKKLRTSKFNTFLQLQMKLTK